MKKFYLLIIVCLVVEYDVRAQNQRPNLDKGALQSIKAEDENKSTLKDTKGDKSTTTTSFDHLIDWKGIQTEQTIDQRILRKLHFTNARIMGDEAMPYFAKTVALPRGSTGASSSLARFEVATLEQEEAALLSTADIKNEFQVSTYVKRSGSNAYAVTMVIPFRKRGNKIERLIGFDLKIVPTSNVGRGGGRDDHFWKSQSVLNAGTWYKLATGKDGVYKVDYSFLNSIGMVSSELQSDQVKLYGTAAGALSPKNANERPDDLVQIPLFMVDGGDGLFNQGDYFLFYGEDQITWSKQAEGERFVHALNPYADSTYYFLTNSGDGEPAKRIATTTISQSADYISDSYDYYALHEEDLVNLIKSGRTWYGEQFGSVASKDFGFPASNIVKTENFYVRSTFAARSVGVEGVSVNMSMLNISGASAKYSVDPVADFYGALYAYSGELNIFGKPVSSSDLIVKMELSKGANPQAQAWLDYIELNARRSLVLNGDFMAFRDKGSIGANTAEYTIKSTRPIRVWDVTDPAQTRGYALTGGIVNGFKVKVPAADLKELIAFTEEGYLTPSKIGAVANQNLHSLTGIEYVIVVHPNFKVQADRLAELHTSLDGLVSVVVTPEQIYNEFSGGAQDVTAIKEFMRKLYFEADSMGTAKPKYLLMFGDASYDYKNKTSGNSNFVPTHQMVSSLSPTGSIASDDYFGLLDDDEGESPNDFVDIGIGRLPARTKKEAEDMVNKIVHYADRSASFGEWRNRVAFVADDADPGDQHTFMRDFEGLGGLIDEKSPSFIVEKLYMDAFKQQAGSGGERYPEGAEAISERIRKGAIMTYYIGHGGELGWSHERILDVSTINKWDNIDNLSLFITATCEFARFDDPRRTSGGEYVLLNPSGGGIALLTTTRAVYSSPNLTLTTAFTTEAFDRAPTDPAPRFGDLMLQTKIRTLDTNSSAALNSRSFALLGDPALRLAYPEKQVMISGVPDTIKALEKVKVTGMIVDNNGTKLEDFNGLVYPVVFDKVAAVQTLNNDGVGPYEYEAWKNLIFKGKATVKNGSFSFEFVVPKDIDRDMGIGRINLYADNGKIDAHGDDRSFVVGGLSDNPIQDSEGPQIDLFMNNAKFVFGGLTNEDPDLYAELYDDNGINMVGSGIGHDLTAVLDERTSNTVVLNEYYEADVDSYQSGKVRYPFSDLEEGKHSLKMKVWDVNNNPADAYLEFVVANDEKLALDHVLNYPNPFTTNTDFYFEHNKPGQSLDVRIEVFTVAGKLIKTLDGQFASNGYRVGPINWNGLDEYGDILAKGVYLYRVSVKTPLGESEEKFERLVLLR